MTDSLFPDLACVDAPEPEKISAGRRRTMRQHADIERGIHPLMRTPINPDTSRNCGNCIHRIHRIGAGRGSWPKCDLTTMSRSAATDCRAWWPACKRWAPQS